MVTVTIFYSFNDKPYQTVISDMMRKLRDNNCLPPTGAELVLENYGLDESVVIRSIDIRLVDDNIDYFYYIAKL